MEQWIQQLGLLGVFLAGATPWLEALIVIPVAIALGLPPLWSVVLGLLGNLSTIVVFAATSEKVMAMIARRRERRGVAGNSDPRRERATRVFQRYGVFGMAVLGPLVIGTQFAAALAVSLGVSAWRATTVVTLGAAFWGILAGALAWLAIS